MSARTPALPSEILHVRPITAEDTERVARWVNRGRREGSFVGDASVNLADQRGYVRRLERQGFAQLWYIVEQRGKPCGYFNLAIRDGKGELLGVYLEPSARGARVGTHLMRGAIGVFRERGCREAVVQILADNWPCG